MSEKQRLALFVMLALVSIVGIPYLMEVTGLVPPPPKKPAALAQEKPEARPDEQGQEGAPVKVWPDLPENVFQPVAKVPTTEVIEPSDLILGSAEDKALNGYRLEVRLEQNGAGVASVLSSRFEAEFQGKNRHLPLQLLHADNTAPPSLALSLVSADARKAANPDAPRAEVPLDQTLWEVVKDDQGRTSQPVPREAMSESEEQGREIAFRTSVGGLTLTKSFRLMKGADGFELTLRFESPDREREVVYKLLGPHGIPIEGEWYTGTFRDAVFGQFDGGKLKATTRTALDIAKAKDSPEKFQTLPLKLAGIENQYFAVFVEPDQDPLTQENRWDQEAVAVVLHEDPAAKQKSDIGIELTSRPVAAGPNRTLEQTFKVFAGPKTYEALRPYGASDLAGYRKGGWFSIPGAPYVAGLISTLLDHIHQGTTAVAHAFGYKNGSYGISIILLTMCVRLLMFPLSRKQAIAAKKMQELQPKLKDIQAKYKDDKERQTKETFALYNKHGVNPIGGCLPALIQLPIFVGLWQALNTSVHLRHAPFLYIQDLAAPDMLFRFPWGETPFLGTYFNLLPLLVVSLMLIQTKLFAPPATTPEAEMQQKTMKYMMVFMAVMFYKVPSGLGIYFITSSLWQVCERLLLPKMAAAHAAGVKDDDLGGPDFGDGGGNGSPPKPPGRFAQLFERVMEEAKKDPTYRKVLDERDKGRDGKLKDNGGDRDRVRDRSKPRPRPGKRR